MKIAQLLVFLIGFCYNMKAQTTFYVDNVTDFYKVIGPNRRIVLKPGDYHLNKIDTTLKNAYCNWSMVLFDEIYANEQNDDDKTLLIENVQNLIINSEGKDSVRILTNRRSASILAFKNCTGITLEGIIFGHDIPKYTNPADPWVSFCAGEVLEFFDCNTVALKSDELFGCGTRGFLAHRCKNFSLVNTVIKECSYGAFGIFDCENIALKKCTLRNNTYRIFLEISNCKNMLVKKCLVAHNSIAGYNESVVKIEASENIQLKKFRLKGNDFRNEAFYLEYENHQP